MPEAPSVESVIGVVVGVDRLTETAALFGLLGSELEVVVLDEHAGAGRFVDLRQFDWFGHGAFLS
jgi:hypothetical protein